MCSLKQKNLCCFFTGGCTTWLSLPSALYNIYMFYAHFPFCEEVDQPDDKIEVGNEDPSPFSVTLL